MRLFPEPIQTFLSTPPEHFADRIVLEVEASVAGPIDDAAWARAIEYLESQRFVISSTEESNVLTAQRGSWLGNAVSFHIKALRTKARIVRSDDSIHLNLNIDLTAQILCVWNYIDIQAELAEFQHYVSTGKLQPDLWEQIKKSKGRFWKLDWSPASQYWKTHLGP